MCAMTPFDHPLPLTALVIGAIVTFFRLAMSLCSWLGPRIDRCGQWLAENFLAACLKKITVSLTEVEAACKDARETSAYIKTCAAEIASEVKEISDKCTQMESILARLALVRPDVRPKHQRRPHEPLPDDPTPGSSSSS